MAKKTNREYLLTMLTALKGKRPAAVGLKVLIDKKLVSENQIMQLLHIFLHVIYKTHDKVELKKLKKTVKK